MPTPIEKMGGLRASGHVPPDVPRSVSANTRPPLGTEGGLPFHLGGDDAYGRRTVQIGTIRTRKNC